MDITKLKAAYAETTPGEWAPIGNGVDGVTARQPDVLGEADIGYTVAPNASGNSRFIALAHNMAPAIIAALEASSVDLVEQERRGELLADTLHLHRGRDGRYETAWGIKTSLGLFLTVQRIIEKGK